MVFGTGIMVEEGEGIDNALRRFRRKVQDHRILSDVKRKVRHNSGDKKLTNTRKGKKKK